jgi:hypothetical protein
MPSESPFFIQREGGRSSVGTVLEPLARVSSRAEPARGEDGAFGQRRKESERWKVPHLRRADQARQANLDMLARSRPLTQAYALRYAQPVSRASVRLGSGSKTSHSKTPPTCPTRMCSRWRSSKTSKGAEDAV